MATPTLALRVAALAASAAAASAFELTSSVRNLNVPMATTNVSWSGNTEAAANDWLAVCCSPGGAYYWWAYTNGAQSGTQEVTLWANGKASGCDAIHVAYYSAAGKVVATTADISFPPMVQQVHLSLTDDPTTMVVDFVSSGSRGGGAPGCAYGPTRALGLTARANSTTFSTIGIVAYALLTDLKPNTTYYYSCSAGDETSDIFSFVNEPAPAANGALRIAVWADFGVDDGFGLAQITEDASAGEFDIVLHLGDFAYNFESGNSANGNFYMNRATVYSTSFPVNVAPGNHEASANFTEYKVRHSGVAAHSNTGSAMFYSFNWQGVHVLIFNSETYVDGGIDEMLSFMRADLAAVDRAATPWVIAGSHKLWWMDATDFSQVSTILQDGNVDLLFAGHWHYYQRYLPLVPTTPIKADNKSVSADKHTYTDPEFVTMIVSGAPGDVERNDVCPGDPTHAAYTLACSAAYGYGILSVFNSTYLRWEFTGQTTPIGEEAPVDYSDFVVIKRSAPPA